MYQEDDNSVKQITDTKWKERAEELQVRVAELEGGLKSTKSSLDYQSNLAREKDAELEDIHAVLDAIQDAPKRKQDGAESWSSLSATARLAGLFAARSK